MSKVMQLSDAVARFVRNGDAIAFGGFTTNRKPIAAVHEIIRQGQGGFTVHAGPAGSEADMLIGAGRVKAFINCYTANSGVTNVCRRFRAAIEGGTMLFEDYSQDAAILMFHAAALGLPYVPIRAMLGSDIVAKWGISEAQRAGLDKLPHKKLVIQDDPFSPGDKLVLLPAPQIDTAIIHVQLAAPDGTCAIEGDEFHDVDIAIAARRVIVTCEELVSGQYIRRDPGKNSIPGFAVDAVVHLPFGAHPSQCYNYYDYDNAFYKYYDDVSRTDADFAAFLDEWVYGTGDHAGYLDKLGGARLAQLRTVPGLGYAGASGFNESEGA